MLLQLMQLVQVLLLVQQGVNWLLLLEYQFRYFHDRSRFKLGCQSRQSGKDFTSEGEIVDDCMSRKTEWMVAAPSERQALDSEAWSASS